MSKAECRYDENGYLIVPTDDIVMAFGVTTKTVSEWNKAGLQRVERGAYRLKDVVEWRGLARLGDNNRTKETDASKKLRADAEYKDAKAKQEAVKLQEMLGNLVPIEMIREQWEYTFTEIRQQLLKLPNDIRARIHTSYPACSEDVSLIAEEIIRRTLDGLSECNNTDFKKSVEKISSTDNSDGKETV